ncbi:MAG: hypothetical protein PHF37_10395 [Phycisphaerae bacterium]|nr:hypothetical protein [Phycisphaerae bacterium]
MKQNNNVNPITLVYIAALSWLIPGAGYFLLGEKKRAGIVFVTILATFAIGLWAGSIGAVDPISGKWWFYAQALTSPAAILLGNYTQSGIYPVYGRPAEIGQIYTSIAGLLNLLCIVNCVYLAYVGGNSPEDGNG